MNKIIFIGSNTSSNLEILSQLRMEFPDHEILLQEKCPGDAVVGDLSICLGRIEERDTLDSLIREQIDIKVDSKVKCSSSLKRLGKSLHIEAQIDAKIEEIQGHPVY